MIKLVKVEDLNTQKNFENLQKEINSSVMTKGGFKFVTFSVPANSTNFKYPHTLNFTPKDAITLSVIGGTLVWNNDLFDSTNLNLTTTGTVTVRAFIGTYSEA